MIDIETLDGQISGRVVDVKDDPHDPDNMVLVVETEDGSREEVVLTEAEAQRLVDQSETN